MDFDLGTEMTVIFIILEDNEPPKIDLDGCHPLVAANIFRNAADMLEEMTIKPTISTMGMVIAADDLVYEEEYDEEEDT